MSDLQGVGSPGLSDIQSTVITSGSNGVNGVYNASDVIVFTVTMKSGKNVDVTTTGGTPRLAITLDSGATAYATFDSTLSGGTTNLSALKFKYVVADGQTDSNGISLAANALSLNGGAIKLYNTTTDAKITTAALADQATYKVDTTAPGFVSAATNGSGSKVILTYAETLDATTATADAFTVKVNGTVVAVSSVAVNASTVELTLATPAQAGQTVTVGYAAPDASASASNAAVQDAAGNDAATLAVTTAVTNNAGDVTPPSVTAVSDSTSASVTKDPISFSVTFSEALAADPTTANFTATNGSVSSVSKVDSTHYSVVVTPTANMASGTVALSLLAGSLKDAAGNAVVNADLSGFDAQGIDTAAPAAPSISTASATINTATPTIAGTAEANSTVSIFDGSTLLGTATVNGSGAFSFSATGLSQAAHSITAKATDAAGNVSAASSAITLTVDTTAPTVTSIAYGTNDGNLALGEAVTLIANMSEAVTVTGTPTLALANGATASYTAGTGTSTLTFSYTPAAGQTTSDLATATTAALTGTIADSAGNAVVATGFNNVNPTGTLAVDVTAPTVAGVSDSTSASVTKDPISFSVTFSEALAADPTTANFTATNGSVSSVSKVDSTHYSVVVTPTSNMASGTVALSLVGGSLKDAAGNAVDNADLSGFDAQGIDTAAPAAPSISTASATINSTSQTIAGTAEANSTVSIFDGSTQLGTATANGSGAFSYSATGLSQAAHSITAKATDAAGNVSAASSAITLTVDTTAPTVTSIAYGTNDGNLALGEAVTLIANMSEAVTVTGTPTLALANGATASYTAGTGTSTLTFSYTPAAGQTTTDLATATTAALTGTIADAAGNAVVATGFNNVNPTGTLAVDVTAPVYQSAASSVDGSKVILTYSESLSATTAATGAFAVTVAGSTRAVSSVAVSGSTVELTLASAIANGQTVTVAYTDPTGANDANAAQDLAGNDAATLAATAVVNNVPLVVRQDPVLLIDAGVYTATSGVDTFVIDASQYMAATINGFAVGDILQIANRTPAQGINILDSTYGNGQTQLTAGVAVITLNGLSTDGFAPSEAGFESTFGTNAIQYNDANAPSFMGACTSTNGLKIGLQFSEALSATTAAANAFAVNVAGVSRAVSSVAVSGTTVELTLASAVAAGQNVTVAYTAPANSALPGNAAVQDASGNDVSALSAQPVTNLVPANGADSSAPTLVDTVVLQDGSILLTFSESILTSTLENADFSVALAGNAGSTTPLAVVATAIKGVANHQVLLTLERPVRQADGVYEVAYKNIGTSGSVHDTSGNAAVTQSMSGADILNLSTADTPGAVEIAGTPTQGQTLSAQLTDVDGVPANVTYQWFAGTVAIANSNASSLALTQAQIGQAINVQASYIDASGHVATVSGIATAGVSNAQLQGTVAITGTQVDGGILTAALSDPDGVELGSSSFQWYADGSAISGAVSDSFTVTSAYVSKQISVSATYIDGDNVTATVIGTPANRPPAGTLGISGTLEENQTLTAINQITDLDGIGSPMIYQWKASTDGVNWSNIAGATTGSLVLSDESLVGKYIQVLASYTDNNGHAETVTANAGAVANRYAVVNNVNDAPLVSGVANAFLSLNGLGSNGQPDAGEVLSVNTTGIADPDGLGVFSFQWFIDNSAVTQLTSSNSYTVPAGNTGKDLYASVVYVDGHGTTETLMTQNPATHLDYVIG